MIRVTLVHGTFAREAAWVLPESTLRTGLTKTLGAVCFDVFQWDGKNRFSSRATAASELAKHLEASSDDQKTPHFLIGHSHGGTVCLLALKAESARARVHGVVCLSTPFTQISKRETNFLVPGLEYGYYILLEVAALILGWFITAKYFEGFWAHLTATGVLASVLTLICGMPILVIYKFLLPDWSEKLAETATLPRTDCPMLIVREPGDEAGMVMAAVKLAKWIPDRLVRMSDDLQLRVLGRSLSYAFPDTQNEDVDVSMVLQMLKTYPLIVFLSIFTSLFSVVSFLSLAPVVILTNIPLLAFGPELILANAFLDVSAEAVPVGTHLVIQGEGLGERAGLRHSDAYEDPSVLEGVASWMRGLVNPSSD